MLAGKQPLTQFGRAMEELGVELIKARSPQAKGRVERSNGVMQDRLVKELRLAGIGGIEQANAWLEGGRYFETLDEKFAVEAADPLDAHRPVVVVLGDVLCVKDKRSIGLDGCVQWQGRVLQLHEPGTLREVEVWQRVDQSLELLGDGRRLNWAELDGAAQGATEGGPTSGQQTSAPQQQAGEARPASADPAKGFAAAAVRAEGIESDALA